MTAEEFRARWTGHAPKVQDVTGEYAVLVPLVERPEGLCLLYEVRADTLGRQPGEVCFPGGRLEPGEDAVSCALRETWEELGIPRPAVEVVAGLWEQLVRVRPHTVYLEGAASGVADALEREGWACWSANVDGRPDGRSQSTQANALLRTLEGRRSAARMLLDDSGESAGILSRLLPRMPRDAYWFQLALDTRI